jgi:hypothetical protein
MQDSYNLLARLSTRGFPAGSRWELRYARGRMQLVERDGVARAPPTVPSANRTESTVRPSVPKSVTGSIRAAQKRQTPVHRANGVRTPNVPRKCPRVTGVCCIDNPNCRFAGGYPKPSDGLEPSTPSLLSRFSGGPPGHRKSALRAAFPGSTSFPVSSSPLPRSSLNHPKNTLTCPQNLSPEPVPIGDRRGPPCVVDYDNDGRARPLGPRCRTPRRSRVTLGASSGQVARCEDEVRPCADVCRSVFGESGKRRYSNHG